MFETVWSTTFHCRDEDDGDDRASEVDELDFRDEDQYWLTDSNLVVEESVPFAAADDHCVFEQQQKKHREKINLVAVERLTG